MEILRDLMGVIMMGGIIEGSGRAETGIRVGNL